jgi:hypothetical protein
MSRELGQAEIREGDRLLTLPLPDSAARRPSTTTRRPIVHLCNGVPIPPVVFCHEGGGPHRSCDACFAVVVDGVLDHSAGCGAAKPLGPRDLQRAAQLLDRQLAARYPVTELPPAFDLGGEA